MRDLIVTQNITLDGVIEATDGWFAPADTEDLEDLGEEIRRQREAADAFLVGRRTFEDMRGFWPLQTDDQTGITDYLNTVAKYVVSSTLQDPQWEPTTVLRGPVPVDIQALKEEQGKDIVATGSISLVHELIAADLVDEYRLFVYPTVLGHGRRLFADDSATRQLSLVQTLPFKSGIVLLRYRANH